MRDQGREKIARMTTGDSLEHYRIIYCFGYSGPISEDSFYCENDEAAAYKFARRFQKLLQCVRPHILAVYKRDFNSGDVEMSKDIFDKAMMVV